MSVLGLGGAFGGTGSFAEAVATVHRALELGITYFDTSVMYMRGLSQAVYGVALEDRDEPYLLATKVGYFGSPAHFRSLDALHAQLHENLRLLRRTRVDTLQLHEADMWMWWRAGEGQPARLTAEEPLELDGAPGLRFLREARQRGACRYIGVTGNGAPEIGRLVEQAEVDTVLTAFNYTLYTRAARQLVFPGARRQGAAVMLGGIFARLLSLPADWRQHRPQWMDEETAARLQPLLDLSADLGMALPELTIRYLMADDEVSCILLGAANPGQVEEAVAAAHQGVLPEDVHQRITAINQRGAAPGAAR